MKTPIYVLSGILFSLFFLGCSKEDNDDNPTEDNSTGSIQELRDFYNDDFVNAMVAIGFTINQGDNPPSIDGSYLIEPFVLENSTIPGDEDKIGQGTGDYQITFSNQNNEKLTIDLAGKGGNQIDEGNGSFITGTNGRFSVFSKTATQIGGTNAVTAVAVSGTLTADGIDNINFFGAMLDDKGDPQNILIENNAGRFYLDGDGKSPRVSSQTQ